MATKRTRYIEIVLYPDNPHHVEIMSYLEGKAKIQFPFQGCYILHDMEEKKPHWHVLLYFPNPRTVQGVINMFGKENYLLTTEMDESGEEKEVYKGITDTTGYEEGEKVGQYSVRYNLNEVLVHCVSDVNSFAMYMIHKTFACMKEGKHEYSIPNIKAFNNDFEFVNSIFEVDKTTSHGGEVYEIINDYIQPYKIKSMTDLILTLFTNGRGDLVHYVEGHSYLIKNLL